MSLNNSTTKADDSMLSETFTSFSAIPRQAAKSRQISLSKRFVCAAPKGNIMKHAVALGDWDNDPQKDNELAVGSVEGNLVIFKGRSKVPYRACQKLGTITCMRVGNVKNEGKNSLVVLAAEGVCYLFEDNVPTPAPPSQPATVPIGPAISMTVPTNTNSILIADLDCDGKNELILGTTDGTVTCYSLSNIKDADAVPYAASVANYANINGSSRDLSFLRSSGGNYSPSGSGSFSSTSTYNTPPDSSSSMLGFSFPFSKICTLLQQLVDVYKRHYSGNQTNASSTTGEKFLGNIITSVRQVEDDSLLPVIAKSPEFKEFEKSVKELQQLPIDQLRPEEYFCFFVNLHNLLTLHAMVLFGCPTLIQRVPFSKKAVYNVGGLVFSLLDIEHAVLRGTTSQPALGVFGSLVLPKFRSDDPRCKFIVPRYDSRLNFVLSWITRSSPALRVLDCKDGELDAKLDEAAREYLNDHVSIDFAKKVITLPKIMDWYNSDFPKSKTELLQFVLKYIDTKEANLSERILAADFTVQYEKFHWDFCFSVHQQAANRPSVLDDKPAPSFSNLSAWITQSSVATPTTPTSASGPSASQNPMSPTTGPRRDAPNYLKEALKSRASIFNTNNLYNTSNPDWALVRKHVWIVGSEVSFLHIIHDNNKKPILVIGSLHSTELTYINSEGQKIQIFSPQYSGLNDSMDVTITMPVTPDSNTAALSFMKGPLKQHTPVEASLQEDNGEVMVMSTNDGVLILKDHFNQISHWELQLEGDILNVELLDVTSDGNDEIIACRLDGTTYIIDQSQNVAKFRFDDRVSAFKAGMFATDTGKNTPVFVYVTHKSEIHVYTGVHVTSIKPTNLISMMQQDVFNNFFEIKQNPNTLEWTPQEQQSLFFSCLYNDLSPEGIKKYKENLEQRLKKLTRDNSKLEERVSKLGVMAASMSISQHQQQQPQQDSRPTTPTPMNNNNMTTTSPISIPNRQEDGGGVHTWFLK